MDNLTKAQRPKNMQNIRSVGTKPEKLLTKKLRSRGLYFTQHVKNLPGKPDIVFRKKKVVVFIDSDFWHAHPKRFIMPRTNMKYWRSKIRYNIARDKAVNKNLRESGWCVVRVWEHDIRKNINRCAKRVFAIVKS